MTVVTDRYTPILVQINQTESLAQRNGYTSKSVLFIRSSCHSSSRSSYSCIPLFSRFVAVPPSLHILDKEGYVLSIPSIRQPHALDEKQRTRRTYIRDLLWHTPIKDDGWDPPSYE